MSKKPSVQVQRPSLDLTLIVWPLIGGFSCVSGVIQPVSLIDSYSTYWITMYVPKFYCVVSPSRFTKKTPYAKPIPKTFQAAWNAAGGLDEEMEDGNSAVSTRAKSQGLVIFDIMSPGKMYRR